MKDEKCVYHDGGLCTKGLPGTECDIRGCVARSSVDVSDVDGISLREKLSVPQLPLPPEFDMEKNGWRYNGGLTGVNFGQMVMPLPFPEYGKKWVLRWRDTPSGELLPEVVQVGLEEERSAWSDGYPKYDGHGTAAKEDAVVDRNAKEVSRNKWQHQFDEKIRREYPHRPTEELAREMGVNYYTVSRRAKRLGVTKSVAFLKTAWKRGGVRKGNARSKVSEAADGYLKEHFADVKNEDLSEHLGVDVKTIRRWARRLGLVKSKELMCRWREKGRERFRYTDEQKEWRRSRIEEVYPEADEKERLRLAEELGVKPLTLANLAYSMGVKMTDERRRESARRTAAKNTKHTPEVIAAIAEYYPDHTNKECAEHFGITEGVINQIAVRNGMRKSREHISRVRSEKRRR